MILIDISYDLGTVYAETVNVVYTTSDYSFDSSSLIYLETFYSISGYNNVFLYAFLNIMSLTGLVIWIPIILIYTKARKRTPQSYPLIRQFIDENNEI